MFLTVAERARISLKDSAASGALTIHGKQDHTFTPLTLRFKAGLAAEPLEVF
jgi:hypothetical protein